MSDMPDQGAGWALRDKIIYWSLDMLGFIYVGVLVYLSWIILAVKFGSTRFQSVDLLIGSLVVLASLVVAIVAGWLCLASDKKENLIGSLGIGCILVTFHWGLLSFVN